MSSRSAADDVLGRILELTRLRGSIYCQTSARAPWGLRFDESSDAYFHVVTSGTCWLVTGARKLQLVPGDVILLPHGSEHALADLPTSRRVSLTDWLKRRRPNGGAFALGGAGAETQVLCGVYVFDVSGPRHPVLRLLPRFVHVAASRARANDELAQTLTALCREYANRGPGTSVIVSRLLDVLFVQVLRAWVDQEPRGQSGWLGALRDTTIARALSFLHDDLSRPWEVAELAKKLSMSRAVLARRFVAEVGISPVAYLTQARMQEAARLLRESDAPLPAIAGAVGYTSEFAFNRAFRRELGAPPGSYRKRVRIEQKRQMPSFEPSD
jgi:AraC-like DNA-binding protein